MFTFAEDVLIKGKYQVKNVFFENNKVVLYFGLNIVTSERVLLKVSKQPLVKLKEQAFHNEYCLLKYLKSPYIIKCHDYFVIDFHEVLVLHYFNGVNLKTFLQQKISLTNEIAQNIFRQICWALIHLEECKVIHRDLKLENIMVDSAGLIQIIDFDTAVFIKDLKPANKVLIGTAKYIAPELFFGCPYTIQTDIYAVGVIFYTLLTGVFPYEDDDIMTLKWLAVFIEKIKVTTLSKQLAKSWNWIVYRSLHRNPYHRYLSAKDLLLDLNKIHWKKRLIANKYHNDDKTVMIYQKNKKRLYKYFNIYSQTLYSQRKVNNLFWFLFVTIIIVLTAVFFVLGIVVG